MRELHLRQERINNHYPSKSETTFPVFAGPQQRIIAILDRHYLIIQAAIPAKSSIFMLMGTTKSAIVSAVPTGMRVEC